MQIIWQNDKFQSKSYVFVFFKKHQVSPIWFIHITRVTFLLDQAEDASKISKCSDVLAFFTAAS